MILTLGTFTFSSNSLPYTSIARQTDWRIAEHKKFNAQTSLQFTGVDSDKITLKGIVYPQAVLYDADYSKYLAGISDPRNPLQIQNFKFNPTLPNSPADIIYDVIWKDKHSKNKLMGDEANLEQLRKMADAGISYVLVDENGFCYGWWGIKSLSEDRSHIVGKLCRKIDFTVNLIRDEDPIDSLRE